MSDFNDNHERLIFETDPIVGKADENNVPSAQPQDESAAQPQDESAAQPQDESAAQPQYESAAQPQDESAAQPQDESASQPQDESAAQPQYESASQPQDESAAQPQDESAAQTQDETVTQQQDETVTQQQDETVTQQQDETVTQPQDETLVQPQDETLVQPQDETLVQQQDEPAADDLNDDDINYGKIADCIVKEFTDTKTDSAVTKKEKVSFKIDDLDEANKAEEGFARKDINTKKARLTPSMLKRIKTILLQKSHCSGNDDFYIGDLIDAVEGELMNLPKKRRKRSSKKETIKRLTKKKIRSINFQRRNICLNMQVLSSSIHAEIGNMDETLLNLRQASNDFNAEFNQPHTPIGEPNAANLRMNELFLKIKDNLPILQDCFKEVKHCSRLFIKADMTLTDNLYNTFQTYFGEKLKGEHIPRVHYSEVLKIFMNSNRQHCHLALDANVMDKTSDTSLDHDKL